MSAGSHWSLRRRLVWGGVALLAIVSALIGIVSVVALQGFLISRLDDQLQAAAMRAQAAVAPREGPAPPVNAILPGLGAAALGVLVVDDAIVRAGYLSEAGESRSLDGRQQELLLNVVPGADPTTVDLGGGLGEYRLIAVAGEEGIRTIVGLPLDEVRAITLRLFTIVAIVTLAALAAAAFIGSTFVRLALRPLDRVASTATRVAELPLARGEVALAERVPSEDTDTSTEVGKVGAALNRMLDHVASALTARELSESKVRRFVADASHELRTPLSSIRGYAELTRRSPHELPEDIRHSLSRIESESVRMTRLVEELLLLARLDEGPALDLDTVDLGLLLADVTSDVQAAASSHEWQLELPDEPVLIVGDRARLHQVFANLLANAHAHTPAGTAVAVALDAGDDAVAVAVRDNGPGIDPKVLPTLFERFVRGDSSRSRAAGSTGLGLAIVRAIVAAHSGEVEVESEAGRTEFRVRLPRSPRRQDAQHA